MSRAVVVSLRPHYVIVPKLNSQHMTVTWRDHTVADPEKGPGGPPPALFLDQNEVWRAKKQIFLRSAPPPYLRVSMTHPPRPPPYLKLYIRHSHSPGVLAISSTFSPSWMLMAYCCNWVCVDVRILRWRGLLNMAHHFDVINCGMKQMYAQFSLLFGLHNAMVLLSKLSW